VTSRLSGRWTLPASLACPRSIVDFDWKAFAVNSLLKLGIHVGETSVSKYPGDADHRSGLMVITIPSWWRSLFRADADQNPADPGTTIAHGLKTDPDENVTDPEA
jgi:hypothetical protein